MTDAVRETPPDILNGARWRLYFGGALPWLRTLPDASCDALITDPPYSSGGQYRGDRSRPTSEKYEQSGKVEYFEDFAGDTRDQHSFTVWCSIWLEEALRVLKTGAPVLMFSDWRQLAVATDAMQVAGALWRGVVPWVKVGCRPQKGRFAAQAEYIVWGSKGPMAFERSVGALPGYFRCSHDGNAKEHPTQKPVALMEFLAAIVPRGALILDPFAGIASTGVGALRTGRRFLGAENTRTYFDIGERRLSDTEGAPDLGLLTPEPSIDQPLLFDDASESIAQSGEPGGVVIP